MSKRSELVQYRCEWSGINPLMVAYHDKEWGVPVHDDRILFEFLILEGAQAGLNWQTVLNKRKSYTQSFDGFDAKKIAKYGAMDTKRLLAEPGIIRNRLKVAAAIQNAKAFLEIQKEFGSFDTYIWRFVYGNQIDNKIKSMKDVPITTKESDAMSENLRKRGFKFVGSTICYAFMQAVGMINDHEIRCSRYKQVYDKKSKNL